MFGLAVGMATPLAYSQAVADPAPNVELAVTYTAERASSAPGSSFWLQGGSVKLGAELYHGLGIAFNVTGTYTKSIPGSSTGLGLPDDDGWPTLYSCPRSAEQWLER